MNGEFNLFQRKRKEWQVGLEMNNSKERYSSFHESLSLTKLGAHMWVVTFTIQIFFLIQKLQIQYFT